MESTYLMPSATAFSTIDRVLRLLEIVLVRSEQRLLDLDEWGIWIVTNGDRIALDAFKALDTVRVLVAVQVGA